MNIENLTNVGMSKTVSNGKIHEINWNAKYDGNTLAVDLIVDKNGVSKNVNFKLTKEQLAHSYKGMDINSLMSNPEEFLKQLMPSNTKTRRKKFKK